MRRHERGVAAKLGVFIAVMVVLTGCLFAVFGEYRSGTTNSYSALFADISDLAAGDSVRYAGVRVGTVRNLDMQSDKTVVVDFDADRSVVLTGGTHVQIRYLNLVGDRFLELVDRAGDSRILPAGTRLPLDRTAPALDLDLLLGGLKPVVQGLNPQDVNALTASLIQIIQGQGGTIESLLSRTSTFSTALAGKSQTIQQLIDHLRSTLSTLARQGDQFSGAIDRLDRLIGELAAEREPIGTAIEALNTGTASLTELLTRSRPALAGTIDELGILATSLDDRKDRVETAIVKAPENYRKLTRLGSYGSFFNYYLCSLAVRVSDLQGRTAVFPLWRQEGGRCAER